MLKSKQNRNIDFSKDYQTEYNPIEDVDKNLNLSQIEYSCINKREYSPIVTTSKHNLKQIYDPLGQYDYNNREKRYRSFNNSNDPNSKNKNSHKFTYTSNKGLEAKDNLDNNQIEE